MSEGNFSDSIHSQATFPLLLFAVGAMMLWVGTSQYSKFINELANYLLLRPDNQTTLLIIIGVASILAGFLGLLRGYLYR